MGEGAESESDYAVSERVCRQIEDERGGEGQGKCADEAILEGEKGEIKLIARQHDTGQKGVAPVNGRFFLHLAVDIP